MSESRENIEHPIEQLLQQRWSPRAFAGDKQVSSQHVSQCLEAARWAPSCFGAEPWRFIVANRHKDEATWQKLLSCLMPKNREWAQHAPVLLMVLTHEKFSHNGNSNRWAGYDAGQAAVSLCLQATALGLATHQMGGFDSDALAALFAIPDDCTAMAAIALGYAGDANQLDEGFKVVEVAARQRTALADLMLPLQ